MEEIEVEVAALKERSNSMEKAIDIIFKKLDDREARGNQQSFMTILNLVGIICTLVVVLLKG